MPSKPFRKKFTEVRLSSVEAARQGRVVRIALEQSAGAEAAVAFLNTHHSELGGRPIDLAVASAAGLLAVERSLAVNRRRAKAPSEAEVDA